MPETPPPENDDAPNNTPNEIDREAVIAAALDLAAERGWDRVSLREIAARAGVGLAPLYAALPGKHAILAAYAEQVDRAVFAAHDDESAEVAEDPARDRLFDVLMTRFDQLQPRRAALNSILGTYRRDPALALGGLCRLRVSMRRMLEAAALDSQGLRGDLRLKGLCALYLATLRVWLQDDSTDMARTMATLDGYLRRIERPAAVLTGLRANARPPSDRNGAADSPTPSPVG